MKDFDTFGFCGSCKFWKPPITDIGSGQCRKNPPLSDGWPSANSVDFCGSYAYALKPEDFPKFSFGFGEAPGAVEPPPLAAKPNRPPPDLRLVERPISPERRRELLDDMWKHLDSIRDKSTSAVIPKPEEKREL